MRALTVDPSTPNSVRLDDVAPPQTSDGEILVRALALGICGTDRDIVAGEYGLAPPGEQRWYYRTIAGVLLAKDPENTLYRVLDRESAELFGL